MRKVGKFFQEKKYKQFKKYFTNQLGNKGWTDGNGNFGYENRGGIGNGGYFLQISS